MSLNYAKPYWGHAAEFQVSGWPFVVSGSVNSTPSVVKFGHVTQWVQIQNTDNSKSLRFGFTENGVNNNNFYLLQGGSNAKSISPVMNLKCTEIWFRSDRAGDITSYSLVAALTNVNTGDFPVLTGSNGFAGVG